MKMLKRVLLLSLIACLLLSIFGCSSDTKETTTAGGTETSAADDPADAPMVAFLTESPKGAPYTDLVWKGFEKLQQDGVDVKYVELMDKAEYIEQIRAMGQLGADVVFGMFDDVHAAMVEVADEFPDVKFVPIANSADFGKENVCSLNVDQFDTSFIAGFVAAKTTETEKIGWIGHTDIPLINRFRDGYIAGVSYVDPILAENIVVAYVGDNSDPVKGKEVAVSVIDQGVDIIYQTSNLSGLGIISACDEAGIRSIGVDDWQGGEGESVFWSALQDMDGLIYSTASDIIAGNFKSGVINYSVENGARVYDDRDFTKLPTELQNELVDLVKAIQSGEVDMFDYTETQERF